MAGSTRRGSAAAREQRHARREAAQRFRVGLLRALAGAMIFSLPMLMTLEMWQLGAVMDRWRLALMLAVTLPMLVALSYHAGFEDTFDLVDDLVDAFVAYAVGFVGSGLVLLLLTVVGSGMSFGEILGKTAIQAVPAAIGAMLAQSQLGQQRVEEGGERGATYAGELFLMAVGALFLSFNLAPTEEILWVAARLDGWNTLALVAVSLAAMHSFVYAAGFAGQEASYPEGASSLSLFLRFTIVGYVVVLAISAYVQWTFGNTDGRSLDSILAITIVLGLPGAVGAAAARLIL